MLVVVLALFSLASVFYKTHLAQPHQEGVFKNMQ